VSLLANLHGGLALLLLCGLIFVEEAGVPVPLLPGDLLLVAGGAMVAAGDPVGFMFFPAAIASSVAGAQVAYSWARLAGTRGLNALARRIHATDHLKRGMRRVQGAGATGVLVGRLLPGTRVCTNLVAGAVGLPRRRFLLGLLPSAALWVGIFSLLGVAIGPALQGSLRHVDALLLECALLIAMGVIAYLAVRRIPARRGRGRGSMGAERGWDTVAAAALDIAAVGSVVVGLNSIGRSLLHLGGIDDWFDAAVLVLVASVVYVVGTRRGAGWTPGEALFGVSYGRDPIPG